MYLQHANQSNFALIVLIFFLNISNVLGVLIVHECHGTYL